MTLEEVELGGVHEDGPRAESDSGARGEEVKALEEDGSEKKTFGRVSREVWAPFVLAEVDWGVLVLEGGLTRSEAMVWVEAERVVASISAPSSSCLWSRHSGALALLFRTNGNLTPLSESSSEASLSNPVIQPDCLGRLNRSTLSSVEEDEAVDLEKPEWMEEERGALRRRRCRGWIPGERGGWAT